MRRPGLQIRPSRMRAVAFAASLAASATIAFAAQDTPASEVLTVSQVLQRAEETGIVKGPVEVREDLDLSRLRAPKSAGAEAPIVFEQVRFRGRLKGVPRHALRFNRGAICEIVGEGNAWSKAVTLSEETAVARMSFGAARLRAPFACFSCRICRSDFDAAQFDGEATFTGSSFGDKAGSEVCLRHPPAACSAAGFADALFVTAARFDRAVFHEGAVFDGAEFRGGARFPRAEAAKALSFVGTRIAGPSEFRDCRLAAVYFGPDQGPARTSHEVSQFSSQADFRGCRFSGKVRFDDAVFLGEALFSRTTFQDKSVSFRGAVGSRSIDLRAVRLTHPQAQLVLDAVAADSVRLDWDQVGGAVRHGAAELDRHSDRTQAGASFRADEQIAMFEALSRRLESLGALRAAREVTFEAQETRRIHRTGWCDKGIGACLAAEAEWWLWILPTRNGGDPTALFAALAALWVVVAAVAMVAARILVLPRGASAEPIAAYALVERAPGAYHPGGLARIGEAMALALRLVFKLGAPQARFAAPEADGARRTARVALWMAWLLSWALLAACAAVLAASFPGLGFLKAAP